MPIATTPAERTRAYKQSFVPIQRHLDAGRFAEALTELERCGGTQFDPRIVRLFVAEYRERRHQIPAT